MEDAGFLLGRYPVGEWGVIKKISSRRKINLTKNTGERNERNEKTCNKTGA